MDTTGTGAVTLSEFKAAIMERRRAIVQQQQEEKALNAMTAEPSDGDGDSTIVAGTGQESREEPPDEKLEGGGRDGSGRGELIASQEREKERGGGESVAASGEDFPTAASTMVDRGMGEAGGEDEVRREKTKQVHLQQDPPRVFVESGILLFRQRPGPDAISMYRVCVVVRENEIPVGRNKSDCMFGTTSERDLAVSFSTNPALTAAMRTRHADGDAVKVLNWFGF